MSLFISLEGPDGGGKSTQARLLVDYLKGRGLDVLLTREPGGTPIGDQIRRTLMDLGNTGMDPRTEILLFSASRAQIVHQVIRPHLEAGGVSRVRSVLQFHLGLPGLRTRARPRRPACHHRVRHRRAAAAPDPAARPARGSGA